MQFKNFNVSASGLRIILAIVISFLISNNAWAQAKAGAPGGSAGNGSLSMGMPSLNGDGASGGGGGGSSASGNAGLTQAAGYISTAASGVGAYFTCKSCYTCAGGSCAMTCAMCASLVANTATSFASAIASGNSASGFGGGNGNCAPTDFNCMAGLGGGPTPTPTDAPPPGGGGFGGGGPCAPTDLTCLGNIAGSKGYKYNSDGTISTPKGHIPASALASGSTAAGAGLIGSGDIPAADSLIKTVVDKMKVVAVGLQGAGGGGGGGSGGGARIEYTNDNPFGAGGAKPKGPQTAGLTRTLASGDIIGAQVDDIFEMISRKYKKKSEEKIFVGQEDPVAGATGAALRAPASQSPAYGH